MIPNSDRELIERYVDRIVVKTDTIEVWWSGATRQDDASVAEPYLEVMKQLTRDHSALDPPTLKATKGIMHAPAGRTTMQPGTREALLEAIAKARVWIDDLVTGRLKSLAEIARQENKVERHVRLLATLAFASPQLVSAIAAGTAPASLKVTSFAEALPCLWKRQGLSVRADE